jgi:hypothetical protein
VRLKPGGLAGLSELLPLVGGGVGDSEIDRSTCLREWGISNQALGFSKSMKSTNLRLAPWTLSRDFVEERDEKRVSPNILLARGGSSMIEARRVVSTWSG